MRHNLERQTERAERHERLRSRVGDRLQRSRILRWLNPTRLDSDQAFLARNGIRLNNFGVNRRTAAWQRRHRCVRERTDQGDSQQRARLAGVPGVGLAYGSRVQLRYCEADATALPGDLSPRDVLGQGDLLACQTSRVGLGRPTLVLMGRAPGHGERASRGGQPKEAAPSLHAQPASAHAC